MYSGRMYPHMDNTRATTYYPKISNYHLVAMAMICLVLDTHRTHQYENYAHETTICVTFLRINMTVYGIAKVLIQVNVYKHSSVFIIVISQQYS